MNPALANLYGYNSPEEMIESIKDIKSQICVDPNVYAQFQDSMTKMGQVKNLEYQVYCKDGRIIWIEEDTRALYDINGNLLYYEGIIQDITERKQQSEKLMRQLQELRIEIDQQKREQEVAKITQSDYFQQLKSEVDLIEVDSFWEA